MRFVARGENRIDNENASLLVHRLASAAQNFQASLENEAGAIVARGSVPTTVNGLKHLRASCGLPAATGVALETGTSAFFVARELARLAVKPVVIDAHEVRRKAQRPEQKSDTRAALELCEGLRRGFYRSIVHMCRVLRSVICAPPHRAGATSFVSRPLRSTR
jgi:transposase